MDWQETTWTNGLQDLIEKLDIKWGQEAKSGSNEVKSQNMTQVVKLANVPTWTRDMSLENFVRQLNIWEISNTDITQNTQF